MSTRRFAIVVWALGLVALSTPSVSAHGLIGQRFFPATLAIDDPFVAIVSVGEPRRFLLRPGTSGKSRALLLGGGDLLVTGGSCQRTWQHTVPKVAKAGPRISITFRHGA